MRIKKIALLLSLTVIASLALQSCRETETYAELKKKERIAIKEFIEGNDIVKNIKVINEAEFEAQGKTTKSTDAGNSENEFVLFSANGVYMQIVNKGSGNIIAPGETKTVLCRYFEYDIMNGDTISSNIYYASIVDKMIVSLNKSGKYSATFTEGTMQSSYGSSYVPQGWLIPFQYVNLGRDTDNLAKVRLIIPHSYGTSDASTTVYPTFCEITFESGR